jgi:hypothetical protein
MVVYIKASFYNLFMLERTPFFLVLFAASYHAPVLARRDIDHPQVFPQEKEREERERERVMASCSRTIDSAVDTAALNLLTNSLSDAERESQKRQQQAA